MITDTIQSMAGSVPGSSHVARGVNNQDAHQMGQHELGFVGIICDGCSSAPESEVGARLQSRFLCRTLLDLLSLRAQTVTLPPERRGGYSALLTTEGMLREAQRRLERLLFGVVQAMGEPPESYVPQALLATVMGVVMTPTNTFIFRRGDGLWHVNDQDPVVIDEDNRPNYPGYALLTGWTSDPFQIEIEIPTVDVQRVLIGSDGMERFLSKKNHPAHGGEPLGGLLQFYDNVYMSPDGYTLGQRKLAACGPYLGWKKSPLDDDTTFIRLQRRSEG